MLIGIAVLRYNRRDRKVYRRRQRERARQEERALDPDATAGFGRD